MEIAVIAVIALIVLGPQKLPEAARSLGKGFREMRDTFSGAADGNNEKLDEYDDGEDEDEFADEDEDEDEEKGEGEDFTPDIPSQDVGPSAAEDHQKEAESSVPSASSSSTERE